MPVVSKGDGNAKTESACRVNPPRPSPWKTAGIPPAPLPTNKSSAPSPLRSNQASAGPNSLNLRDKSGWSWKSSKGGSSWTWANTALASVKRLWMDSGFGVGTDPAEADEAASSTSYRQSASTPSMRENLPERQCTSSVMDPVGAAAKTRRPWSHERYRPPLIISWLCNGTRPPNKRIRAPMPPVFGARPRNRTATRGAVLMFS